MQTLEQIGAECVESIRRNMDEHGINATGRTSNALFVDARSEEVNGVYIPISLTVGLRGQSFAPAKSLELGQSAEECAMQVGLEDAIFEWVQAKGIETDPKKAKRAAGAISHSLRAHGTQRHAMPDLEVITPPVEIAIDKVRALVRDSIIKVAMVHKMQ